MATKAQIEYAQQAYEREKRLYPATLQKAADAKAEMERLNKLIWRKPGRLNGWKFLFIISSQRKVAIDATWSYKAAELRYTLAQRDAEWHADAIRRQDELLQALLREPLEEEKPLKPKNDDERSLERDITDSLYYDEDDDEKNDAGRGGIDI